MAMLTATHTANGQAAWVTRLKYRIDTTITTKTSANRINNVSDGALRKAELDTINAYSVAASTLQIVTTNGDTTTQRMTVLGPTFKTVLDTSSIALIDGAGIRQAELNTTSTSGELILRNSIGGSMVLVCGSTTGLVPVIGPTISGTLEIIMPFNTSATDANFIASGAFVTYILPSISANRTLTMPTPTINTTIRICNRNISSNNWVPSGVLIFDSNGLSLAALANPCTYTLQGDGTNWVMISK